MKKLTILVCLLLVMASASHAVFSMGAVVGQYNWAGIAYTGYGLEIGIGLIPFVDTRIVAVNIPVGGTLAVIPTTLNFKYNFPFTPLYIDAGAGVVIYNVPANSTVVGTSVYNAALGLEGEVFPFTKMFIQGGIENLSVNSVTVNGSSVKAGVRFNL